ncbi:MAG: hypothetical protein K9M10_04250 [Candidatus Pacebacteria bacterium]|nr:hypothetical protein [Candidatus Paceibacterota bacterium]MCF7857656.1 hypothetical protein [Candidatus Paceibacterota bacterium]
MLYVYFGNDVTGVRQKALAFINKLDESGSSVTHITSDLYHEGILSDCAQGESLFGEQQIVLIDTPSDEVTVFDSVFSQLELLGTSKNHFVLIEGVLNAAHKKKVQAHATTNEELTAEKKERFNAFLLTDALINRDKKSLWFLLAKAKEEGLTNEEIIGVLFWQVKILRLASLTKSAEEAGQKQFVYNKAKRALGNFKKGEIDEISRTLLSIYHDDHLGKRDAGLKLEQWVLGM